MNSSLLSRGVVLGLFVSQLAVAQNNEPTPQSRSSEIPPDPPIVVIPAPPDPEVAHDLGSKEMARPAGQMPGGNASINRGPPEKYRLWLRSSDRSIQIRVRGLIQPDARVFITDPGVSHTDNFYLRRARLFFDGVLLDNFGVRLMPDFATGQAVLFDAFAEARLASWFELRFGKFRPPIGFERLQSAAATTHIERGLQTNLVPNRDVGVQVGGNLLGSFATYSLGVFNGAADLVNGDADPDSNKEVAGRVYLRPFHLIPVKSLRGIGFGASFSYGNREGNLSQPETPQYRSTSQLTVFQYTPSQTDPDNPQVVLAHKEQQRVSLHTYASVGRLGLLGEYVFSKQGVQRADKSASLNHQAWVVTLTTVLYGGNATYDGFTPTRNFDPSKGDFGAFELALRYTGLRIDPNAFPFYANLDTSIRKADALGVSLHWYPNPVLRFTTSFENTMFKGGAKDGANREPERVLMARSQVAF